MWRSKVSHGAIVPSGRTSKLASVPADAALGPVAVGRPDVALDLVEAPADAGAAAPALAHRTASPGSRSAELEPAAVDADDRPDRRRVPRREFQHDVAAPRLSGHDRAVETESFDQGGEVVGDGRDVVGAVRLGRSAVTAQVDGPGCVPARGQGDGDAVPHPRVRREAVDEEERRLGRLRRIPAIHREVDALGDLDPFGLHPVDGNAGRRADSGCVQARSGNVVCLTSRPSDRTSATDPPGHRGRRTRSA